MRGKLTILAISCYAIAFTACGSSATTKGRLFNLTQGVDNQVSSLHQSRKLALLIGINHFQHDEPWHDLRFAVKDANDLRRVLLAKGHGEFDSVVTLNTPRNTSLRSIQQHIKSLISMNVNPRDTILVYISSHGTLGYTSKDDPSRLQRFIVTSDTDSKRLAETGLSIKWILARLNQMPSQRKVLIMSFCHSGHGKSVLALHMQQALSAGKGTRIHLPIEIQSEASVVLAAAAMGETAYEDDDLKNDVYTHFFIKALRQRYDLDLNGATTVLEAHAYASTQTYKYTQGKQRPTAMIEVLGKDPIVLSGRILKTSLPLFSSHDESLSGVEFLVNGRSKAWLPDTVVLEPGHQTLSLKGSGGKLWAERKIYVRPGEYLQPRHLLDPPQRWDLRLDLGAAFVPTHVDTTLFSAAMPKIALDLRLRNIWGQLQFVCSVAGFGHGQDRSLDQNTRVRQNVMGYKAQIGLDWEWLAGLAIGLRAGGMLWIRDYERDLLQGETGQIFSGTDMSLSPAVGLVASHRIYFKSFYLGIEAEADYFFLHQKDAVSHAALVSLSLLAGVPL